jgi:hypothetical protein
VTQEEVEIMARDEFKGNVGLIAFSSPIGGCSYKFKAMYCPDRENAAWVRCARTDSNNEDWALLGQELSDKEITKITEDRLYTPLKTEHPPRPLTNDQTVMFTQKMSDEDEERSVFPLKDPLELYRDLQNWKPHRASTPVHYADWRPEPEDRYKERVITVIIAQPHQVTLCLPKDATVQRIIEVFKKRTGRDGTWEGRITSEQTPRIVELVPVVAPTVPCGPP